MDNFEVVWFEDNGSCLLYSAQFIGHMGYCLFSLHLNKLHSLIIQTILTCAAGFSLLLSPILQLKEDFFGSESYGDKISVSGEFC